MADWAAFIVSASLVLGALWVIWEKGLKPLLAAVQALDQLGEALKAGPWAAERDEVLARLDALERKVIDLERK